MSVSILEQQYGRPGDELRGLPCHGHQPRYEHRGGCPLLPTTGEYFVWDTLVLFTFTWTPFTTCKRKQHVSIWVIAGN